MRTTLGPVALVTTEVASTANGTYSIWVFLASLRRALARDPGACSARGVDRARARVGALGGYRQAEAAPVFPGVRVGLLVELNALEFLLGAVRGHSFVDDALALVAFVALTTANWLCVSLLLPHSSARWTDPTPGAVFFAVGLLVVPNTFNLYILGKLQEQWHGARTGRSAPQRRRRPSRAR